MVVADGLMASWTQEPGRPGVFQGPLRIVVPALTAAREQRLVRIGGSRLRADGMSPAGAMVALMSASERPAGLLSAPAECWSLWAWAHMLHHDAEARARAV